MKKILIADDSVLGRMLLKKVILEEAPESEVREVAYGDEALRALRTFAADLVLLDYDMPGMNGLEAAMAIQQQAPDLQIVLLAIEFPANVRQQISQSGVSLAGLVEKPVTSQNRAQIRYLLGR